jgi:hypothetical protein
VKPAKKQVDYHTIRFGLALILVASIFVILNSLIGVGPVVTIQISEGITAFAVAYLMAQFIERAVEPFSDASIFGDTERIEKLRKKKKRSPEEDLELDKSDTKRVCVFWGLTSAWGIILCYFTVGLFEVVGVFFQPPVEGAAITGHAIDSIFSGIIVGGGTKPLHDLISYLQKAKQG